MKQGNGLRIHRASLFHAIRRAYVLHSEYYKIFTYAILSNLSFEYLPEIFLFPEDTIFQAHFCAEPPFK